MDHLIKVAAKNIEAYDAVLRLELLDGPPVSGVRSRIAVVKDSPALPIRKIQPKRSKP